MNFNTPEYLLFLAVTVLADRVLPGRLRRPFLLLASWGFYWAWHPMACLLLIAVTGLTFLCAGVIGREKRRGRRNAWLALALTGLFGLLGVMKYAGFLASLLGMELPLRILLPVGISFYTFQTAGYVLDVWRGRTRAETDPVDYALFVGFFPQLVAGPIERSEHLLSELRGERRVTAEDTRDAFFLLLTGYVRKVVIADALAPLADRVFASPGAASGPEVLMGCVLFAAQIYCDFAGYSEIARGSALLLGVRLSVNFRRPYAAVSLRDFWRRWHMTLGSWFTDYVYIPLGGSRRGKARQVMATLAVFALSGLWHGAAVHFVFWGLLHGAGMAAEILLAGPGNGRKPRPAWPGRLMTLAFTVLAWLFFRAGSLMEAFALLSRLGTGWQSLPLAPAEGLRTATLLFGLALTDRMETLRGRLGPEQKAMLAFLLLTALALSALGQAAGGGSNAFLYFQF